MKKVAINGFCNLKKSFELISTNKNETTNENVVAQEEKEKDYDDDDFYSINNNNNNDSTREPLIIQDVPLAIIIKIMLRIMKNRILLILYFIQFYNFEF